MKVHARFVTSAAKPADFPPERCRELAVVGRSNVGKSSLINSLVGQTELARTSRTPGRTRLANWFEVDGSFHLVDLPGYGYAEVEQRSARELAPLIETFLTKRARSRGVLLLVDVRRGVEDEELDFVPWLAEQRACRSSSRSPRPTSSPKNKRMLEVAQGQARARAQARSDRGVGADRRWHRPLRRALAALVAR